MQLTQDYTQDISRKFRWMHILLLVFAGVVLARLFVLQLVKGGEYRRFSQEYSIRDVPLPAPRGLILDRFGQVLASNQPTLDLVVIPQYVMDWDKVRTSLVQILQISPETLDAVWERRVGRPRYQPLPVMTDLPLDAVSRIRAQKTPWHFPEDPFDLRGVEIQPRADRRYTDGSLAPHVLGYLEESGSGTLQGASGIEAWYGGALQGMPGSHERVVDARGRVMDYPPIVARLIHRDPVPGATIQTHLDIRLQEAARRAFGGRAGALVALDPATGEVFALYSSPAFDLSRFSKDRSAYWRQLLGDKDHPLYNRAVQGAYPPGSTYKMVTALAALSEAVVTPDEKITCRGGLEVGGRRLGCWNKGGHGPVSLVQAIAQSCDVYFYTLGSRLGLDRLAGYAHRLGLGAKTGIDLPHEKSGLIPTGEWKEGRYGRPGTAGDAMMAAIGQGFDLLTPLQDALMVARIVNGGRAVMPHVVRRSPLLRRQSAFGGGGSQGEVQLLDIRHLALIRQGMEGVVNAPGGTARSLATLNLKIAGKTGTAQTVGNESKVKKGDHAWFVGYAPYDDPKIVVAVIVEYAGHGSTAAAPIVGEVIKVYLRNSEESRHAVAR